MSPRDLEELIRRRLAKLRSGLRRFHDEVRFADWPDDEAARRHADRTEAAFIGGIDELENLMGEFDR